MVTAIVTGALALAQFWPQIMQWLQGNKNEEIATQIVNTAKRVTKKEDIKEIVTVLKTDPNIIVEFQNEMLALAVQFEQMNYKDIQDARIRDLILSISNGSNRRGDIMVIAAALGLIVCLGVLGVHHGSLPGEAVGIISTICGIFGACLKDAYGFEFGSSRGSKEKDEKMSAAFMTKALNV